MGFFDSLFGNQKPTTVEVVGDHIWMTTDAKFAGLAREVAERSNSQTVAILLVAHFPDVLAWLEELASGETGVPVKAVLASSLSIDIAASLNLNASDTLDLIVGERHPLPSVDERLEQFASELPCRCRLSHHLSLEDPVLSIFAGEWVRSVLGRLGMKEDEAIESQMVSRRIKLAQQKIEGRASGNSTAESAAQWLEKYCPELANR